MVRLVVRFFFSASLSLRCFNSSMVRLVGAVTELVEYVEKFQFQYGAIGGQTPTDLTAYTAPVSIPVWCDWWLESAVYSTFCQMFQFQYGAIGGHFRHKTFQHPHRVSIPVWCDWWGDQFDIEPFVMFRFNSSMVRLVDRNYSEHHISMISFNSSMVRLVVYECN